MTYQPDSFTAATADRDAKRAMRSALREFKALSRAPIASEHPLRDEILVVLADARLRIDRINAPAA